MNTAGKTQGHCPLAALPVVDLYLYYLYIRTIIAHNVIWKSRYKMNDFFNETRREEFVMFWSEVLWLQQTPVIFVQPGLKGETQSKVHAPAYKP